ncbi:MAG: hypothetical protein ABI359_09805 [Ginsengibacter sp.]
MAISSLETGTPSIRHLRIAFHNHHHLPKCSKAMWQSLPPWFVSSRTTSSLFRYGSCLHRHGGERGAGIVYPDK